VRRGGERAGGLLRIVEAGRLAEAGDAFEILRGFARVVNAGLQADPRIARRRARALEIGRWNRIRQTRRLLLRRLLRADGNRDGDRQTAGDHESHHFISLAMTSSSAPIRWISIR